MNFENWISYRYLTASKGRFLSFLHFISIAGVAIGVLALIVVTGVMTGFGNNLREKIIGSTPHIVIEKETGVGSYDALQQRLAQVDGVVATSPYIQGSIFLEHNGPAISQVVRGIQPETEGSVTKIRDYLVEGRLEDLQADSVFIGSELANYFGFQAGDDITLIAPGAGIAGKGWKFTLRVAGIFNTGMVDVDTNLLVMHLDKAREIFNYPADKVSGIGVKLTNPQRADHVKEAIYQALGYSFLVKTWIDVNRNLFEALFLEKWGLFIVLTLMVLVASFNIVSTLVVTVTSKVHDIGILKSFGVTGAAIRRIFTRQGILIGMIGTFWGLAGGIAVSYILRTYVKVPEQIYSIDHVPIELQLDDLVIIVLAAMLISWLATIYPAAKAARLEPVEALRYE